MQREASSPSFRKMTTDECSTFFEQLGTDENPNRLPQQKYTDIVDVNVYKHFDNMDAEELKDLVLTLLLNPKTDSSILVESVIKDFPVWSAEHRKCKLRSLEIFYVFFEFFPLMGTVVCDIVAMFEYGDPNKTWSIDLQKAIFNAAKFGRLEELTGYLQSGAPIDCTPFGSQSPLYIAAFYGKSECVDYLCSKGAELDKTEKSEFTPAHAAASQGHLTTLQVLRNHGANLAKSTKTGQTCFSLAKKSQKFDVRRWLEDLPEVKKKDLEDPKAQQTEREKTFFNAAKAGNFATVRQCVEEHNCEVDCTPFGSQSPLYISAFYGQIEILRYLIQRGADLDKREKAGYTPAHAAASKGKLDCLIELAGAGADLNAVAQTNQTCLVLANKGGHNHIVRYLRSLQANPANPPMGALE